MGRAWSESAKWFHVATVTMPVVSKMGLCDEPPGGLGYGGAILRAVSAR